MPARSEYWRVLARAHFRAHDYKSATEAVEKSLKLTSRDGQTSSRLLMSMIRYDQGRHGDARVWYIQALDRQVQRPDDDPDMPAYWSEARELLKPVLVADHLADDAGP